VHRAELPPAAPETDGSGVRLESPQDVEFALNALLGRDPRDAGPGEGERDGILGRLRPAPTVVELVDAVFAWRRQARCAEEVEKAEEAARRRHALRLLCAYFLLDPPVPGEARALAS
jgi:hypothetical protein